MTTFPYDYSPTRSRGLDVSAVWLLLLGGFLMGLGWVAGLVLLWNSPVWTGRQKWLGTLCVPGGLATVVWGLLTVNVSAGDPGMLATAMIGAAAIAALIGPIAVAIYLARQIPPARR